MGRQRLEFRLTQGGAVMQRIDRCDQGLQLRHFSEPMPVAAADPAKAA